MKATSGLGNLSLLLFLFLSVAVITTAVFINQKSTNLNLTSKAANPNITVTYSVQDPSDTFNETGGKPDVVFNRKPHAWIGNGDSKEGQYLGLHLTGFKIPKQVEVVSAKLDLAPPQTSWIQTGFDIFAEKKALPDNFSTTSLPSVRSLTVAKSSVWENVKWEQGQNYQFDVTAPTRELIAQTGSEGKINLVIRGTAAPFARKFIDRMSPKLTIIYVNPAPIVPPPPPIAPPPPPPGAPPPPPPTPVPPPAGNSSYPVIPTIVPPGEITPVPGEKCPDWLHGSYKTTGPDGKTYQTWHPTTDPFWKCNFWHEHGSDPRKFIGFKASGMPAFGYVVGRTGIPSPHNGYKVYVINDNTRGKAMLRSLHFGTGSPLRAQIRWHELQISEVAINNPNQLLVDIHQMMDFGYAPSCGEKVGVKGSFPDKSGFDNVPSAVLDTHGKKWVHNGVFRGINVLCPDEPDGIMFQNRYEQWQGAINVGDLYRTMANYNLGEASTLIDPNNLDRVVFHCKSTDPGSPNCPAGSQRQFKYFGEIVSNTTGNPVVYADPFGKVVSSTSPMAIKQYITLNGWDTFGNHQPDGVVKGEKFDYYRRFGLNEDDGVFIVGNIWHQYGKGIVRWPN